MFTCSRCKKSFNGTPQRGGPAGNFCSSCEAERISKVRATNENKKILNKPICQWCGGPPSTSHTNQDTTCLSCQRNRDWLLACIRYSSKPFEYITRTEQREAALREKRKNEIEIKMANNSAQPELKIDNNQQSISRAEYDALTKKITDIGEGMTKLIKALGGV